MVLSADFIRNVGLHYLLATDINHSGDIANFDPNLAAAAVATTLANCGVGSINQAITLCPGQSSRFRPRRLHPETGDHSGLCWERVGFGVRLWGRCLARRALFRPTIRTVGAFGLYHSGGRSVYNGLDLKLTQNVKHPFTGVKYLNFQASYTFSRYVNAGSTGSGAAVAGGDADFLSLGLNNRNPLSLTGPGSLDRTHQFNFGGYADLPAGLPSWLDFALLVAVCRDAVRAASECQHVFGGSQVEFSIPISWELAKSAFRCRRV